ncbi:MAG TPA: ribosome-binding factor A [Acidimicrobiales bacterium]|nr:ribosome-binding factor A [Acidimicrobiales bacterium]
MNSARRRAPQRPYPRVARVNALLQEILAEQLERLADVDERLRLLTVTAVECEPGLRQAVVFMASLPGDGAEALEEHRRALQRAIGIEARLKRTPALAFRADPSVEAGAKVDAALRRAKPVADHPDDRDGVEDADHPDGVDAPDEP